MLYQLPDSDIERFIQEDMPYGDLTTLLLGIGALQGTITFTSRETTTLCCTEEVAIKAIMAGGALPHRLGLSESVLVFRQHTAFCGGLQHFLQTVAQLKATSPEQKIIVEADSVEEALQIAASGVDVVQLDKLQPEPLSLLVQQLHKVAPEVKISVAGGITLENASAYAETGVDMLVLSSLYFGKPSDIAVTISALQP